MPTLSTLTLFMLAALALLITPGPAVLYVVARSIDQGRLAGIVSTLGIGVGTLFHVGAAALGLSTLLMSSALTFSVVKYLGAAYLGGAQAVSAGRNEPTRGGRAAETGPHFLSRGSGQLAKP